MLGASSVRRCNSTRVDEARKGWILLATKMQGAYRSGEGGKVPAIYVSLDLSNK